MNGELKALVLQISKDKDLETEIVKQVIEESIVSVSKKTLSQFTDARCSLDILTGDLNVFVTKKVVEDVHNTKEEIELKKARKIKKRVKVGEEVEVEIAAGEFGRIAAQSVRQGIMQRLREAERDKTYYEYKDRIGQLVSGVVQQFDRRDVIISCGKADVLLPRDEQPYGARYNFGDRLRALIIDVDRSKKGPLIIVSRKRPEFIVKLFEQEVPEISEGLVAIKSIAREAGVRTKIAVDSNNPDVDPVGACVGMKGSRVQMIVRELEREKVDIVPYSADPRQFVTSALNPAKILKISLNESEKIASIVVDQETLSIAIGKRGQNAELASRLTGWKIDILSHKEIEQEKVEEEIQQKYLADFLSQIDGLSEIGRDAIAKSSYSTVEKIASISPSSLLPFTSDSPELAKLLVEGAQEYLEALREMEASIESGDEDDEKSEDGKTKEEESTPETGDEKTQKDTDEEEVPEKPASTKPKRGKKAGKDKTSGKGESVKEITKEQEKETGNS